MHDQVVFTDSPILGPPELFQPVLAQTARSARTALDPLTGALCVLHRRDIEPLLHDPRMGGVGLTVFDSMGIVDGPLREWYGALMFTTEGETHHRLRSLVQRAFTPTSVEALRPFAANQADRLLQPLAERGDGDLIPMAIHLPIRVMARHLGVPLADVDSLTGWSMALAPVFGFMTPEQIQHATDALTQLSAYVDGLLATRASCPADDLISRLLAVETDDGRLTDIEVRTMVINLIVGGHDTSTSQIACSLLALLAHPEQIANLRRQPHLLASAAEETMRYQSSLGGTLRVTTQPIDHDGLTIDAGQLVVLATGVAGLEADAYGHAARLDVERFSDAHHAPRMLNFGAGPHHCLGASLARVLVQEAIAATLRLPQPVALACPPKDLSWTRILGAYPSTLPVTTGAPRPVNTAVSKRDPDS